ncbi:MAG: serine hydrolase [Elusimicrobia bacterium]|nr:serine hydrolase [Elusimicrobiota bacterium]
MTPAAYALGLLVAALGAKWIAARLRDLLAVGAAYKAKVLCSALFVSGLDLDVERADEVSAEAYRALRLFGARVDRERRRVSVSFFGWGERRAVLRPGYGAALEAGPVALLPPPPPRASTHRADAPWPAGDATPTAPPAAVARVLKDAFAEHEPRRKRRTRAIVVVQNGKLLAEAYAPGFTPATPLCGWSMTKSAFAVLLGGLIGEGRLSASSRGLLPQWAGPGDRRADITLEDLLRMRSGLLFSEIYSDMSSDVNRMLFVEPDAGAFAAARPLEAPPGARWQYASGTSNILSLIARRTLGERDYPDWPRRALFEPLGFSDATLEADASGTFVASSYLFATARDWARLGLLMAQDGVWDGRRLLAEGWVRFLTTPTPQSPQGRYGAHWWLKLSKELGGQTAAAARLPADAFHALGHEGQCLTVIASRGLVVVRLGLSIDISAWDHAAFLDELLSALDAPAAPGL